jgi:predicted nucleic acid-binding Zn ribbon protein
MTMGEYGSTQISDLECPICKCKNCLSREYYNVSVIYKTTGFNATDSLIENKEMDTIMKSGA